jgi:hypothetical protein
MVVEFGVIGLGVLALAIILGIFMVLRSIKHFAINALIGLIILFLANAIAGLGIGYSWLVILICAIGGTFGAVLVIILHLFGIAF